MVNRMHHWPLRKVLQILHHDGVKKETPGFPGRLRFDRVADLLEVDVLCRMVVHCVGIPAAPLAGVDHVLRNIDIQRDDGLILVDHDGLGLLEDSESLLSGGHCRSLGNQGIVLRVGILAAVHSGTCDEIG